MVKLLKYIYKTFGLVIFKKRILILINRIKRGHKETSINVNSFSLNRKHVFFGYYDINPFSIDQKKILSIVVPNKKKINSPAIIGYFNIDSNHQFHQIGTTKTWCWQQGARLRWSNKDQETVIFNNMHNKKYGCIFQNFKTKEVIKQLSHPIYDLSKDERYGLSLNFSRLQRLRAGYGYDILVDDTIDDKAPKDDGVFLIDVQKNTSKLIISLETVAQIEPQASMAGAEHYINHLSWNKSSTRFLFFHLWTNGNKRSSRLFTCDKDGANLYLLENKEAVSHYDWKDDEFICLTTASNKHGVRYSLYRDLTDERKILDSKHLREDGHPTYHPTNENLILSDTYPDKYGERKLFAFDINKLDFYWMGKFKSPIKYRNDYRCDLHPRWSHDGKKIAFDSTHSGLRTINIIDFEDTLHS